MGKGGKNKLEGSAAVARKILLFGNVFATLLSLGLVGLGIMVKYGRSVFKDQFASVFDKMTSYAKDAGTGNGMDFSKLDFVSLFGSIATFLIGAGVGTLLLSVLGITAAKKKLIAISVPYAVILGILLLVQTSVIVVVVVKRSLIDRLIKPSLVDGITNGYRGYNETDATSQAWNLAMLTFSCCGVDGYHDFSSARLWGRKLYQDGWWFSLETPVPCCKMDVKLPDDFSCAVNPSTLNSNYEIGCYEAVLSSVDSYRVYLLIGLVAALFLQVTLCVSAVIVSIGTKPKSNDGNEDNEIRGSPIGINRYFRQNGKIRTSPFCRQGNDPFQFMRLDDTNHGGGNFGDSFDHLFSGFKPNGLPQQYGIAGLLNAMHGMSAFRGMPGMMFAPPQSQRYGPMSREHMFDNAMPSQEMSLYRQNDAGLTSFGLGRASGPIIVQLPLAITNTPNGLDSRRTSVDPDDDPSLKQFEWNSRPHLTRQQTAPVLNVNPTGNMKNTKFPINRSNTTNGDYGTGTSTPSSIHVPPLTEEEFREIDRRLRTETV